MSKPNLYPNLPGRKARQRLERDRAHERALVEAFDGREADRLASLAKTTLAKALRTKEQQRVAEIIERDKADRQREIERAAAEIELASGKHVYVIETHIGPTPEWLHKDKGEHEEYTPRQHDKTTVQIRTVRRVQVPQARKMLRDRVIDLTGYIACEWYENLYEATGFAGNVRSVELQREVFATPASRAVFTDFQVEAQDTLKFIRSRIEARHLRLLDAMILQNIPINRAVRIARAFHRNPKSGFAQAVDQLVKAREEWKGD